MQNTVWGIINKLEKNGALQISVEDAFVLFDTTSPKTETICSMGRILPEDCIRAILEFYPIIFRGTCKKYMNIVEHPARSKLDYLQAMNIKDPRRVLRIYFGKQETNVHILSLPRQLNNYCWASTNRKGLRCNRRCKGRLCWQHMCLPVRNHNDTFYWYHPGDPLYVAVTPPVLAAPRFHIK